MPFFPEVIKWRKQCENLWDIAKVVNKRKYIEWNVSTMMKKDLFYCDSVESFESLCTKFCESIRTELQLKSHSHDLKEAAIYKINQVNQGETQTFVCTVPVTPKKSFDNSNNWFLKLYLERMCKYETMKGAMAFNLHLIGINHEPRKAQKLSSQERLRQEREAQYEMYSTY